MPTDISQYSSLIFAVLLLWLIYRRVRRTFGRQLLSSSRMTFRAVFLGVIGTVIAVLALPQNPLPLATALVVGLGTGVLLGLWGAAHTSFEREGRDLYYVPHTYSGLAVTALFLGRLAYRYLQGHEPVMQTAPHDGVSQLTAVYGRSPLTLGFFFVLVGYYVCYYSLVLHKARRQNDTAGGPAGTPVTGDSSKPA